MTTPRSRVRHYPRLRITREHLSVLVSVGPGHRAFEMRRFWVVRYVQRPGVESRLYAGRDDSVFGWVDCIDWSHATIQRAGVER